MKHNLNKNTIRISEVIKEYIDMDRGVIGYLDFGLKLLFSPPLNWVIIYTLAYLFIKLTK